MRIALLARQIPPAIDAVGDYAVGLGEALARMGNEVLVLSSTGSAQPLGQANMRLETIPDRWGWTAVFRLVRRFRNRRVDLINLQYVPHQYGRFGLNPAVACFPLLVRLSSRTPVVTTCHELLGFHPRGVKGRLLQGLYSLQAFLILLGSSRVVVPAVWQERQLARWPRFLSRKVCRIPVGASVLPQQNTAAHPPASSRTADVVLGTFGTGHPWWQYPVVLQTLRALIDKGVPAKLLCLGDIRSAHAGRYGELQEMASSLGIADRVEWTGPLSAEALSARLRSIDVFLAFQREGMTGRSTALMSALAHGLPVVASRGPQADPWIMDSGALLTVHTDDLPGTVQTVASLATDPEKRAEWGGRALRFYQENCSWDLLARRFMEMARSVTDRSNNVWTHCWDEWASKSDYREDIEQHLLERGPLYRLLEKGLPPNVHRPIRILEVACGTAIDAHLLAQDAARLVIGVDRSEQALRVARRISSSFQHPASLVASDGATLCFSDESFDLVFSQGFLEHFRDPLPFLHEQVRVLRRRGTLVVDVPQAYAGLGLYSLRKHWKIHCGKWPWGWETQYSYPQLKRMGRSLGLESDGVAGYGFDGLLNLFAHPDRMIDRHSLLRKTWLGQTCKRIYLRHLQKVNASVWNQLCRRWGHWFLICIAVRFRKP